MGAFISFKGSQGRSHCTCLELILPTSLHLIPCLIKCSQLQSLREEGRGGCPPVTICILGTEPQPDKGRGASIPLPRSNPNLDYTGIALPGHLLGSIVPMASEGLQWTDTSFGPLIPADICELLDSVALLHCERSIDLGGLRLDNPDRWGKLGLMPSGKTAPPPSRHSRLAACVPMFILLRSCHRRAQAAYSFRLQIQ